VIDGRAPAAVLFDLDGTLVETVGARTRAWGEVFDELGIPYDEDHVRALMGSDGQYVARQVAEAAGHPIDEGRAMDIDRLAGEAFGRLNAHPRPVPGAGDLLKLLDERGIPWAIATSSRPDQVTTSVDALGLPRRPEITDGSHVHRGKPEPDLLLAAAEQADMEPSTTWYVGDSRWDMMAAVAAGMPAIGVATGATDEPALWASGAELTFPALEDLRAELERRV
jgi:HAD superfamily hydrolase (TIGR01509 family)